MPLSALKPLQGSSIHAAGYDAGSQTFMVQFNPGGRVSQYFGVPQSVASDFEQAESKGRFIGANIRGKFDHESIEPDAAQSDL